MQIMFAPDWFQLRIVTTHTTHTLSGKLVRKELFPKKPFCRFCSKLFCSLQQVWKLCVQLLRTRRRRLKKSSAHQQHHLFLLFSPTFGHLGNQNHFFSKAGGNLMDVTTVWNSCWPDRLLWLSGQKIIFLFSHISRIFLLKFHFFLSRLDFLASRHTVDESDR